MREINALVAAMRLGRRSETNQRQLRSHEVPAAPANIENPPPRSGPAVRDFTRPNEMLARLEEVESLLTTAMDAVDRGLPRTP